MNLTISNLSKTYSNGVKAMQEINLQIGKGMFGLLGPNGAGKSTLMRTIATLQRPDAGGITFQGIDVQASPMQLRKLLGYLPQEFGVYPGVSAERLLYYFARLKGIAGRKQRDEIVEQVLVLTNLYDVRKKQVSSYSGGMKQRFGIAQLLLNNPSLIIVDEPTAGLDPAERVRFLNILRAIGTENTVIFSTHIVEDVKDLCHDMAIMNEGQILARSTPKRAVKAMTGQVWTKTIEPAALAKLEQEQVVLSSSYTSDNRLCVRVYAPAHPGDGFEITEATLEDVYFQAIRHAQ